MITSIERVRGTGERLWVKMITTHRSPTIKVLAGLIFHLAQMKSNAGVLGFPTVMGSLPEAQRRAATRGPASGMTTPGLGPGQVSSSLVATKRQWSCWR